MEDNFDIQQLIETRNFDQLNLAEKNLVLKDITADEYTQRRNLLLSTKLFLQESVKNADPKTDYKESIQAIMQARKTKQRYGFAGSLFMFRIPAYIPAAAILLLFFMIPLVYTNEKPVKPVATIVEKVKPVYVYKTDTVTVEKVVPTYVKVPVVKYVEVVREISNEPNGLDVANVFETNNASAISAPNAMVFAREQLDAQLKNIGKSSAELQELNRFLVVSK